VAAGDGGTSPISVTQLSLKAHVEHAEQQGMYHPWLLRDKNQIFVSSI